MTEPESIYGLTETGKMLHLALPGRGVSACGRFLNGPRISSFEKSEVQAMRRCKSCFPRLRS